MLGSLTVMVLFEVAGDCLQKATGVPVPGPVIGMALLLGALLIHGRLPEPLDRAAGGLLSYLPILFVPAGVGVMAHFDLLRAEWPAIIVAITVSSVLAIVVTASTMEGIERLQTAIRAAVPRFATSRPHRGAQ